MADAKNEPRGLTIPDLMILVAGTALAMSLPERNFRPPLDARPGQFATLSNLWSLYIHEQLSRLCVVLGLLGWSRCILYRRPIKAPEFLALALGWHNVCLSIIDWEHGWVQLYDLELYANGSSKDRNEERYQFWYGSWAVVGLFSALLLAFGPLRRRIPVGLVPLLLVLCWHALGHALPACLREIPMTEEYRVGERRSTHYFGSIFFHFPLAAMLLAARRRPAAGWPPPTWMALAGSLFTVAGGIAVVLTRPGLNRLGPWYLPSVQWFWEYPYLAVPPIVLLLEILLLAWATRTQRTQEEPPA
jgi:hypothetical protein